ncbi:MAG: hypothetical protein R2799_02405 [Crocinitomicaceae bacterium]
MSDSRLFREALKEEAKIQSDLLNETKELLFDHFNDHLAFLEAEKEHIWSLETIEKLCLKYRLRFLDSELFKGDIPQEAWDRLAELEDRHGKRFRSFRIIAPGEFFELNYVDKDPIMLAELSPNKYLFIHKWGKDMKWWRQIKAFPFQSYQHFFASLCGVAFVLASLIAIATTGTDTPLLYFSFGVFKIWIALSIFSVFIALAFNIYPTKQNWNSQFLDK